MSINEKSLPLKIRGAGVIFYILPTDQLMFFLRDDKPSIPWPNMVDIIGGRMEAGETPEQGALREIAEELVDNKTGRAFIPPPLRLFKTFVDERPGEHNIFICELDSEPDIHTVEGQGLVFLTREEARKANFAYGYSEVVNEYLDSLEG